MMKYAFIRRVLFTPLQFVLLAASCLAANAQSGAAEINGTVKDERGALIVGATVSISNEHETIQKTISDAQGQFRFAGLKLGLYKLSVEARGFGVYEQPLETRQARQALLSITLYPTIKESVAVNDDSDQVPMDSERAAGTMVLKQADVDALPDDPDEMSNRLQQLATSAGGMPGGATVTVDGFLVHGRLPSKASIREIRINPDLYSAEYDKPPYKGGRIEILTKPGTGAFHGSAFLNFNDSLLNARNAFALVRPSSNTRRFGFELGGPIVAKKSGFYINFERREIDESSTVNALVLNSAFQTVSLSQNVPSPARLTIGSIRFDWQANTNNTFIARYDFNQNRLQNRGVGGFNLADRGVDLDTVEHTFRFTLDTVFGTTMVNEARLGITAIHISEAADSHAPAIVVPGAFSSGGAGAQSQLSNDLHLEIGDNLSLVAGRQKLKFGAQLLGRVSDDSRTDNFNGMFLFGGGLAPELDATNQVVPGPTGPIQIGISGLEQYRRTLLGLPGGTPTTFSITSGDPQVHVNQWLFSAFVQDEWKFRRNITFTMGLRYEAQTNPTDKLSLAPRVGIAYSVDKKQHWILRAHAGLFFSRIPDTVAFDVERNDGQREKQILINNPSFADPLSGIGAANAIPAISVVQPGINPEASWQTQIALEHQLLPGWTLNASLSYSMSRSVLRSLNINAPIVPSAGNPQLAPRPLGITENILQYQSTGETRGPVTFVGVKHLGNKYLNLFTGYLYFHLRSNADTPSILSQSSFSQAGEWARPIWQSAHRGFVAGTVYLPWHLRASPALVAASGTPFNITTGIDNNGDGNFTDRPSLVSGSSPGAILTSFGYLTPQVINGTLPRNFGTNPPTITLDLDMARDFTLGGKDGRYKLTINAQSSNLLNHVNITGLNGVLTSPFFDRANGAGPARKIEFGARFSF